MSTAPKEKKPENDPTAPPPDREEVEATDDETRMDDFVEDEEDED